MGIGFQKNTKRSCWRKIVVSISKGALSINVDRDEGRKM